MSKWPFPFHVDVLFVSGKSGRASTVGCNGGGIRRNLRKIYSDESLLEAVQQAGQTAKSDIVLLKAAENGPVIFNEMTITLVIDSSSFGNLTILGFGGVPIEININQTQELFYVRQGDFQIVNLYFNGMDVDNFGGVVTLTESSLVGAVNPHITPQNLQYSILKEPILGPA